MRNKINSQLKRDSRKNDSLYTLFREHVENDAECFKCIQQARRMKFYGILEEDLEIYRKDFDFN